MAPKKVHIGKTPYDDEFDSDDDLLIEKEKKALERARIKAEKEAEKRRKQEYLEKREEETNTLNLKLQESILVLESILNTALSNVNKFDLEILKLDHAYYPPPELSEATPKPSEPRLREPSIIQRIIPSFWQNVEKENDELKAEFAEKMLQYKQRESWRISKLEKLKQEHSESIQQQHQEIDALIEAFNDNAPKAIAKYYTLLLEISTYPPGFPQQVKIAFVSESKQLVIDYELPALEECIPDKKEYKYIKSKDEIKSTPLPNTQRKKLYAELIAQITLRSLYEVFTNDSNEVIETIVFNGHVNTIDPSTGQPVRPCLVTVRTTKDTFMALALSLVDPVACLKGLNASVSQKPEDLAPVRPVLEFNMVDPRYIEETDVISSLDQRMNLMDLDPFEFENLISNLFGKMGLETRQTQSSRDGGVDCVAYDPRPIFGGKVIIQAKRYKNTVGVSAVRDLFGTLQNEGASKGILVTTSGYGKAAYEFADGKPLELLDGSNLLYLLAEHADLEAKIEIPEDWKEPKFD